MSDLENRIKLAVGWFGQNLSEDEQGNIGWGWVPDVPANPQNTAEVVCVLSLLGETIPERESILRLVRADTVTHRVHGGWAFSALIDVAWRLRALRCLTTTDDDPAVAACVTALLEAQDPETGGWRMAGRAGAISISATVAALEALLNAPPATVPAASLHRGIALTIEMVRSGDERARRLHAASQVAHLLSLPIVAELGGPQSERVRNEAAAVALKHLRRRSLRIEEEVFRREGVTDIWRHLTLPLSLRAVCHAAPEQIFDPGVRAGLSRLLELQEGGVDNVNRGGFRTSEEGFVTSYATTQALEVLAGVRTVVDHKVNPGRVFDLLCREDGMHHTDPQQIFGWHGWSVVMNSGAGLVVLITSIVGGASVAVLAFLQALALPQAASRTMIVTGSALIASGSFVYLSVRFPRVSSARIAVAVFTAFTAVVFPVVTFLVS